MGKSKNPHNPNRYGETWPQDKIDACLAHLESVRDRVVVSGGWAWHFMSPLGHRELKHAHDHKDVDLLVPAANIASVVATLKARGLQRVGTRYDGLPDNADFRRYECSESGLDGRPLRVTFDVFVVDDVPTRSIGEWTVVEPNHLLSLYKTIHSSATCFAAVAAERLLAQGVDPVGSGELLKPCA